MYFTTSILFQTKNIYYLFNLKDMRNSHVLITNNVHDFNRVLNVNFSHNR